MQTGRRRRDSAEHAGRVELAAEDARDADRLAAVGVLARADLEHGGAPVYDDLPQYSAGCALKICSPLISRIVSATTLIQCMIRTAQRVAVVERLRARRRDGRSDGSVDGMRFIGTSVDVPVPHARRHCARRQRCTTSMALPMARASTCALPQRSARDVQPRTRAVASERRSTRCAANAAPAIERGRGPDALPQPPGERARDSSATPHTRLKTPNAVPRRSAGAAAATSAASSPCVEPMCRPHSAAPASTPAALAASASTRSRGDQRAQRRPTAVRSVAAVGAQRPAGIRDDRVDDDHRHHHPAAPSVAERRRPARAAPGTPRRSARASAPPRSPTTIDEPPVEPPHIAPAQCALAPCAAPRASRLVDAEDEQRDAQHRGNRPRPRTPPGNRRRNTPSPAIASSGPSRCAPTVSSACRRPKLAPRTVGGVMSAISASRGAPRMPLPTRSAKRAATTQPSVGASGNTSFDSAASAVAGEHQRLAPAEAVGQYAGEHLDDQRDRLGDAFDDADRRTPTAPSAPTMYSGSSEWISSRREVHAAG